MTGAVSALKLLAKLVLGFGSVWSFAFGLGLYWFFPMNRVKDMAEERATAAIGKPVTIGELDLWRFSGVQATDVAVQWAAPGSEASAAPKTADKSVATVATSNEAKAQRAEDAAAAEAKAAKTPPVKIDRAAARVRVLPLILGTVKAALDAEALGGEVSGTVAQDRKTKSREIDVEFSGLELGRLPMWRELLGVPITGSLGGAIDLRLDGEDFAGSAGEIKLNLGGVKIGKGKIPLPKGSMFPFYDLETVADVGNIELAVTLGGEKSPAPRSVLAKVTHFAQTGGDIALKLDGDVTLLERIGRSRPNMQLQIKPSEAFVKRAALSMVIDNPRLKRYQKDGWIGLHLGGTLSAIRPKPKRPTPPRKNIKAGGSKRPPKGGGSRPKKRKK